MEFRPSFASLRVTVLALPAYPLTRLPVHSIHAQQTQKQRHHPGRPARPQPRHASRRRLRRRRLRQAHRRHRQRLQHHHPLQCRPRPSSPRQAEAAVRAAGGMPQTLRHHHGQRRHLDGHRGDEVLAGLPRGHRRLDRDRLRRPEHGRRAGGRRLRQEHARRHDRDRADEHPRRSSSTAAPSSRGTTPAAISRW